MRRSSTVVGLLLAGLGIAGFQAGCLNGGGSEAGLLRLLANVPQDAIRIQKLILGGNANRVLILQSELPAFDLFNPPASGPTAPPTIRYAMLDLESGRSAPFTLPAADSSLALGFGLITDGDTIAWINAEYDPETGELAGDPQDWFIGVHDIDSGAQQRFFEGLVFDGTLDIGPPIAVSNRWLIVYANAGPEFSPALIVIDRTNGEPRVLRDGAAATSGGFLAQQSTLVGDVLFYVGHEPDATPPSEKAGAAAQASRPSPAPEGDAAASVGGDVTEGEFTVPAVVSRLYRLDLRTLEATAIGGSLSDVWFASGVYASRTRVYWQEENPTERAIRSVAIAGGDVRTELVQPIDPNRVSQALSSLAGVTASDRLLLARSGGGDDANPLNLAMEFSAELRGPNDATTPVYSYRGDLFRLPWYLFGINIARPVSAFGDSLLWRDGFTGEWMLRNPAGTTVGIELF